METVLESWKSRFETPTIDALLAGVPVEARAEMEAFRKRVGRSSVRWKGTPWRWTIQIDYPDGHACLVPDPESPRVAIALSAGFFAEHPPETLPRPARDLLLNAVSVGEVVWSEWSLGSPGSSEAILDVLGMG